MSTSDILSAQPQDAQQNTVLAHSCLLTMPASLCAPHRALRPPGNPNAGAFWQPSTPHLLLLVLTCERSHITALPGPCMAACHHSAFGWRTAFEYEVTTKEAAPREPQGLGHHVGFLVVAAVQWRLALIVVKSVSGASAIHTVLRCADALKNHAAERGY